MVSQTLVCPHDHVSRNVCTELYIKILHMECAQVYIGSAAHKVCLRHTEAHVSGTMQLTVVRTAAYIAHATFLGFLGLV